MSKPLNFNNVKKKYLTVTLADSKNTTLMIGTPTKQIMDELMILKDSFESMQEDVDNETLDCLFNACSRLMSRNKGNIKITKEYLESIFDFEDIMIFFNAYMEFISEINATKN